jgi:hypothetical protein
MLLFICITLILFLIIPFIAGYLHKPNASVIYFRYFVAFNIIITALIIASRNIIHGPHSAAVSGWAYSPMFQQYGMAMLSIALFALLNLFKKSQLQLAAPTLWVIFLLLATILHIHEIMAGEIKNLAIIWAHIGYNIASCIILSIFILKLKRHESSQGAQSHG